MTTEITTMTAAVMAEMAGMARTQDVGEDNSMIPRLKINYDETSKHKRGVWVVGQTKDKEGNITDEGRATIGFVILSMRRRYSYYFKTDVTKNCNSQMFSGYDEQIFGSTYKLNCRTGECPMREKTKSPRCKCQWAVFGMALTEDKKLVDCIAYIQGASYMVFENYRKALTMTKTEHGPAMIPAFAHLTLLDSTPEKNAGVNYFVGKFTKGGMFSMPQIRQFNEKLPQIDAVVEAINSKKQKLEEVTPIAASITEATKAQAQFDSKPAAMSNESGIIDISDFTVLENSGSGGSAKPFETQVPATPVIPDIPAAVMTGTAAKGSDFDIEGAIKAALSA